MKLQTLLSNGLSNYGPIEMKVSLVHGPFHSLILYLLLRLMFSMNTGLWSNPTTLKPALKVEEDRYREGISQCDYSVTTV